MTRILFINHNMHYGGAQRVLINLLKELSQKSEYQITLYLMELDGAFLREVPSNVEIKYLTYSLDKIKREKKYAKLPKKMMISAARRILGEDRLCRLLQNLYTKDQYHVQIAVKEGISKIMLAHSNDDKTKKVFWVHTDLRRFKGDQRRDSFYYGQGDKIICVSDKVKEGFLYKHPELEDKVTVVHNIINTEDIISKSAEGQNPYDQDQLHVVNLGRVSKEKAQDRLIKAHKELLDKGYPHHLHIIGEGEERPNLQSLINELRVEKSVTLWGAQSNPYPYLKYADIYIHSSINEGLPTVLYEAITLNLPIVSTDVSGVKEVLEDGKYGLIVENTYEDLLAGYEKVLKDENMRKDLKSSTKTYKNKNEENVKKYLQAISCKL